MDDRNGNDKPVRRRRRRKKINMAQIRRNRITFLGFVMLFCVCGLIFRMWFIQRTYGDDYERNVAIQIARKDISRVSEVFTPVRGGFVDRNNQPLTGTEQVFTVFLDAQALHERQQAAQRNSPNADVREEVINAIALSLNVPRWEIIEMFNTDEDGNLLVAAGRHRRVLRHNVPAEIAIPLSEEFAEIYREETSLRWYQDPFFAPQVIGFMRGDSIWGLESYYNTELSGEQGRNLWVQGETETIPVRNGYTVVTTLDSDIQRIAQYYVNRTYEQYPSEYVGMIVMDPMTGEILAMTQAPTFSLNDPYNPEHFTNTQLAEVWDILDDSTRTNQVMSLWRNYHTTRSAEPGSVFKPFVVAAAIEEGRISPNDTFFCEGRRQIYDMYISCHNPDWGCGTLTVRRAIYRSCNLALAEINERLGRDLFFQYRGYFGFGERTGIDLPGEESVSNPAVMYPLSMLNPVEMATSAMGQGFNTTTMQMINGYAALINGGNLLRPYLVSQIVDDQNRIIYEQMPEEVVRRVISPETSNYIRTELQYVVSQAPGVGELTSTGWRANIPGHSIGGKTGTAQQGARDSGNHNLTFVAFMPVHNPQYLVLMTIDHVEDENLYGGDTVTPIVREFLLDLIRLRNIQPTNEHEVVEPELFGTPMPDFSGQRLSDVIGNIMNMGSMGYQVIGGGTVVSHHWPAAGNPLPETSPIILYTDIETRIPELMVSVPDLVGHNAETAGNLLNDLGLRAVVFTDERINDTSDANDRTSMPEPVGENPIPPPPLPHTVYRQFPSAGSEVEQGTQIMIRAR